MPVFTRPTRKASVDVVTITIACTNPKCKEPVTEPHSGSYLWTLLDMQGDEVIICPACGTGLTMPTRANLLVGLGA